jgi:hypothetical protein
MKALEKSTDSLGKLLEYEFKQNFDGSITEDRNFDVNHENPALYLVKSVYDVESQEMKISTERKYHGFGNISSRKINLSLRVDTMKIPLENLMSGLKTLNEVDRKKLVDMYVYTGLFSDTLFDSLGSNSLNSNTDDSSNFLTPSTDDSLTPKTPTDDEIFKIFKLFLYSFITLKYFLLSSDRFDPNDIFIGDLSRHILDEFKGRMCEMTNIGRWHKMANIEPWLNLISNGEIAKSPLFILEEKYSRIEELKSLYASIGYEILISRETEMHEIAEVLDENCVFLETDDVSEYKRRKHDEKVGDLQNLIKEANTIMNKKSEEHGLTVREIHGFLKTLSVQEKMFKDMMHKAASK